MIINPNDDLQASNVLSRIATFHVDELDQHLQTFLHDISKLDVTVKGPFFYSLNNIPLEKIVKAEFFMPVREYLPDFEKNLTFRSYFGFDEMISITLFENIENRLEEAYARMLYYIQDRHMDLVTPIFHVLSGNNEFPYTQIKMGVAKKENDEVWK